MYAAHFGLKREPFSLAPDPRFLFMSERHREALAHLLYGVRGGGGFVLLTGEIGAGKTTVVRCLLEQLPSSCVVAYVFNPKLTSLELLQTVCHEFGITDIADATSGKAHVDALNRFLLAAHAARKQALLVIDEAQALDPAVLEQLRLLTNLETAERKLLQIVLVGQPELRQMLAQPGLEQLAQRVIARYHLGALSAQETRAYVRHRLAVAGLKGGLPFDAKALALVHEKTAGVPRRINLLADRALLGAYGNQRTAVDRATVKAAAGEVFAPVAGADAGAARWLVPAVGGLAVAVLAGWGWAAWWPGRGDAAAVAAPAASAAPAVATSAPVAVAPATPAAGIAEPATRPEPAMQAASSDIKPLLAAAHADEATAWRELALRWNVSVGEGEPCVAVLQAQLACFRSNAGMPLVRQLARPVLLPLKPTDGPRVHALLVGLTDTQATLLVGQQRFVVTLPALVQVWRGDFATLWRTPPGWKAGAAGIEGNSALRGWVQEQLAAALPGAETPRSLAERVSAFQVLGGLPADGVAGPVTLMQINRAAGIDEPRLAAAPAGRS
jgi:general secretion pathway protein A